MKRLIPLLVGLSLVSCDTVTTAPETKDAEGTSSETQTALQALADSLSMLRLPETSAPAAAARAAIDTDWVPEGYVSFGSSYEIGSDGDRHSYFSSARATPGDGVMYIRDTSRWINGDLDLTSRWLITQTGSDKSVFWSETEGTSRTGFHFSYRVATDADREAMHFDSLGLGMPLRSPSGSEDLLYTFDGGWNLVLPWPWNLYFDDERSIQLPILHYGKLAGWLEPKTGEFVLPIKNFSLWQIRGLDGTLYAGRELPRREGWVGDSMGVFFGSPRIDSSETSILIPYRWRFFPGTIAAAGGSDKPFLEGLAWLGKLGDSTYEMWSDSLIRAEKFEFLSDEGSSIAIVRDVVKDGRTPSLDLGAIWVSSSDSGRIDLWNFRVLIPELSVGGTAGAAKQTSP